MYCRGSKRAEKDAKSPISNCSNMQCIYPTLFYSFSRWQHLDILFLEPNIFFIQLIKWLKLSFCDTWLVYQEAVDYAITSLLVWKLPILKFPLHISYDLKAQSLDHYCFPFICYYKVWSFTVVFYVIFYSSLKYLGIIIHTFSTSCLECCRLSKHRSQNQYCNLWPTFWVCFLFLYLKWCTYCTYRHSFVE